MSSSGTFRPRRAALGPLLVMFAVLAGLLGMHGLAPSGALLDDERPHTAASQAAQVPDAPHESHAPQPPDASHSSHASSHWSPGTRVSQMLECVHGADGSGGGHTNHADSTCAASGVSAAPVLPALLPALVEPAQRALPEGRLTGLAAVAGDPPSLAELQILRI